MRCCSSPACSRECGLIGSAAREAVLIPDSAIGTDQSRRFVYVVGANDVPEARPVVTGPLDAGLRVIRSGLGPQDRVVVGGIQQVRPGQPVAVQERAVNVAAGNAS
jgi:multidrug efflux system membrane fusion protein